MNFRVLRCRPWLMAAALVALGNTALAQTPAPTQGPTLSKEDFLIEVWRMAGDSFAPLTTTDAKVFFNRARCECAEPVRIVLRFSATGETKRATLKNGEIKILAGIGCLAETLADRERANCTDLGTVKVTDFARAGRRDIETTVRKLFARQDEPEKPEHCHSEFAQTLWIWENATTGTATNPEPELKGTNAPTLVLELDGQAPSAPTDLKVTGGNEALSATWTGLTGTADINGYVVFCARGGEYPVFAKSGYDDQYSICASTPPGARPGFSPGSPDAETGGVTVLAPEAFRRLSPEFLCSDLLTSQTDSRIAGLENGIPYVVGVASVDRHGNASPIETAVLQKPVPTRDFYREYRGQGGVAEGGCSAGGHPGRFGSTLGLCLVIGAVLLRRSRIQIRRNP